MSRSLFASLGLLTAAGVAVLALLQPASVEGQPAVSPSAQGGDRTGEPVQQPERRARETKASPAAEEEVEFAKAVFAGGCFWCTEAVFEELSGVVAVTSGYVGGSEKTANYKAVSTGKTKHAEAIEITYDPSKISFEQLLEVFFDAHDPTQLNQQGPDVGTQYRSAVFYADESQRDAARARIEELTAAKKFRRPIVTTLEPLERFYVAESDHQDFASRNPNQPYVRFNSLPKVKKVREKHADLLRKKH